MQIVIDIPRKLYDRYKEKDHIKWCDIDEFEKALDSCVILPKGHGDLIDRNELIENGINKGFCDWYDEIKFIDAIIEADKEDKECLKNQ